MVTPSPPVTVIVFALLSSTADCEGLYEGILPTEPLEKISSTLLSD